MRAPASADSLRRIAEPRKSFNLFGRGCPKPKLQLLRNRMNDNDPVPTEIFDALQTWAESEQVRIDQVRCTNQHLLGHAFKYAQGNSRLAGVYPFEIEYTTRAGARENVQVMIKAKPNQVEILAVYQRLLDAGNIQVSGPLDQLLQGSDYTSPNLKELVLFRDFADQLKPYLPASFGFLVDPDSGYSLRIEQTLAPGSVILSPDDDTTEHWQPGFSNLVLVGMADLHSRFLDRYESLLDTGLIFNCDTAAMTRAEPLWQGLLHFIQQNFAPLMTPHRLERHRRILETLDDWYPQVDRLPQTLLYGDVNPQNLAFEKTETGFQLSLFDWERALVGLPQRDLAEHLIYTLVEDFDEEEAMADVSIYRQALSGNVGTSIDETTFNRGLKWMLYDLVLNRLPLMLLVKHVAHKRRHSDQAYENAHRLIEILDR